jgi:hypothetical protein
VGRNLHIEKLLNVSIASKDDFVSDFDPCCKVWLVNNTRTHTQYTRVLLPWQQYDGMRITWSKWQGFDHLMAQVPEEVPAPQIQTRFESGQAFQQRYGQFAFQLLDLLQAILQEV